ncbi:MAG: aminomethyl-transferring glycine dehydrogenase subunit GcvPA [Kiritimatiellae bacterium]|nr:aminomethyl-transferring glycine dehydrogenase subunit GcvPA [Kiritimatiellia bacterium]
MSYVQNTVEQRAAMLAAIGVPDVDALFADIPETLRAGPLDLPLGLSEHEVYEKLHRLSHRNAHELVCFLGGGFYDHAIPAAVDALASRGEFYTAYTPYQPEASQGTLQAIFEYQSAICRLTRMDVANASLYDGGTALVEAALMALRITGRRRILLDSGVNPIYRRMLACYTSNLAIALDEIPVAHGQTDRQRLRAAMGADTAAVILQNPNFFGAVDDFSDIVEAAHAAGSLAIVSVYPISLGLLKAPGLMGADIVTGEGQSLGLPLSFGGPYLGFMATRDEHVRRMPGRLAGMTVDRAGRRSFVLTLQAREQHIRREKATSNICSNEALCALRAVIYLSLLGKQGLPRVARLCAQKAEYAKQRLGEVPGVSVKRSAPTFNEFTLELPADAAEVVARLAEHGVAGGFPLGRYYPEMANYLLVAVTEKRTKTEIGHFAEALEHVLGTI